MERWMVWVHISINLVLLLVLIRLTFRLALFVLGYKRSLPYVPSGRSAMRTMIESGDLDGKKKIVDLGCGTGTMLVAIGKAYPNAELYGVEKNLFLVLLARLRFVFWKKKPTIVRGDMFAYPTEDADAIVGFWISGLVDDLMKKFENEVRPGTVIMSNLFKLPDSDLFESRTVKLSKSRRVHFYKKR